jgi:hypothetical protein
MPKADARAFVWMLVVVVDTASRSDFYMHKCRQASVRKCGYRTVRLETEGRTVVNEFDTSVDLGFAS